MDKVHSATKGAALYHPQSSHLRPPRLSEGNAPGWLGPPVMGFRRMTLGIALNAVNAAGKESELEVRLIVQQDLQVGAVIPVSCAPQRAVNSLYRESDNVA